MLHLLLRRAYRCGERMEADLDEHVGTLAEAPPKRWASSDPDTEAVVATAEAAAERPIPAAIPNSTSVGSTARFFNSTAVPCAAGKRALSTRAASASPPSSAGPEKLSPAPAPRHRPTSPIGSPTFCAIAKTTAPKGLDGTDLTPALTKGIFKRSKPMIWEFHGYSGQLAVIDFPWKAVRQKAKTKKPGDWQLYNLEKDAAETNDLAAKLPKIVNRLEKVFKNDRTKSERNKLPLYDLVKQK